MSDGAREPAGQGEGVARALGALHADDDRPCLCRPGGHESATRPRSASTVTWSPRIRSSVVELVAVEQERGEVAAGDLARRPPQRVARDLGLALAARDRAAHEAVVAAREQDPAQDGPEGLRLDRRSGARGDRLGDGVGLLGGEPALLDRERGPVAGGVDAVDAGHAAVLVDRDEALGVARDTRDVQSLQPRQADDAVDVDPPAAGIDDQVAVLDGGVGGSDELDAGAVEELGDGVARRSAEDRDRPVLGGHEDDLEAIGAHRPRLARRHQRELVERQRPGRLVRHHERDALGVALLRVAEQPVQRLLLAVLAEGDGVRVGGRRPRAGREHQVVVGEHLAAAGAEGPFERGDLGHDVLDELRVEALGDARELVALGVAHGERLRDRHRAIGEGSAPGRRG